MTTRIMAVVLGLALAAPAAAQDWNGFYGGVTGTPKVNGINSYTNDGRFDLDGQAIGVVGGWMQDRGPYVWGGELALHRPNNMDEYGLTDGQDYPDYKYTSLVDVKGRIGWSFDQSLVFVSGGYSTGRLDANGEKHRMNGWALGFGVDYRVTPNIVLGAEYLHRELKSRNSLDDFGYDLKSRFGTAHLRLLYKF